MPASEAHVQREGDALVFSGTLDRAACTRLWANATLVLAGTQRLVLSQVTAVDSAGLALLAEIAARLRAAGTQPQWQGEPTGLSELRAAYRLTPGLGFPGALPAPK